MSQNKEPYNKDDLEMFLREMFLELRHTAVEKVGGCNYKLIEKAPLRDIIGLEELVLFLGFKDESLLRNLEGIHHICFEETVSKSVDGSVLFTKIL